MTSLSCCLCRFSVDGDHRKRKRLHGRSCDTARAVVCKILDNALDFTDIKDPAALLCISCDKLLNNIKTTEVKLEKMYSTIKERLTALQMNSAADNEENGSRKRPRVQEESVTDAVTSESFPTSSHQIESSLASEQPSQPVKVSNCLMHMSCYIPMYNYFRL